MRGPIPAALSTVSESTVDQRIDGDRSGRFLKSIVRADCPSGRSLAAVRKRQVVGAPRASIILIHGFAQNRYSFHLERRSFANHLAADGIDVWNLELCGHGRSREFGSLSARTFTDYVDDAASVAAAIAAESGRRTFLLGHSLGGAVCYATAPRIPGDLAGTITLGGMYRFGANPVTAAFGRFLTAIARAERWLAPLGAGLQSQALGRFFAHFWKEADDLFWSLPTAGWAPGSTEPEVLKERLARGFDWTGINIFLEMMRWAHEGRVGGGGYEEDFAAMPQPLLVIAGDHDGLLPPGDARPAWEHSQSTDKQWRLLSPVRDGGHWGHLDIVLGKRAPVHVWPLVSEWILERAPGLPPRDGSDPTPGAAAR